MGDAASLEPLPAAWARRWAEAPGAPALLPADGRRPLEAGELAERSGAFAASLLERAEPGNRVLWLAGAGPDDIVAAVAVLRAGLVLVPVSPELAVPELRHVVAEAAPALGLARAGPGRQALGEAASGLEILDPSLAGSPSRVPLDGARGPEAALVVFTSGTTGARKGAVLTHANLAAGSASLRAAWRWGPEDRLSLALPLFHVHGLCAGLFSAFYAGGSVVAHPRFEPAAVLEDPSRRGATMFFGVPTMYHRLVADPRVGELARLRLCVSGSAPMPVTLFEALRRAASVSVLERYGMTETLLTMANPYEGERRPGTVGLPLPQVEAHLEPVPGGVGELWVRGPTVFAGYLGRKGDARRADGWFPTGDLGVLDEAGYLVLKARRSEVILSGGFNVYPAEVEEALSAHPQVADVAVVGRPSSEWGETVVAFVVPRGACPSEAELLSFAAGRLAPYRRPREVRFLEALPRNALGKVDRGALASRS